eukprot:g2952.t1
MMHALHQKRVAEAGGPKPLTPENLVEEAKKTLAVFNVTGLSFAVVGPGGELVACEGVGTYTDDNEPVSCNNTLFQIASDTKQFTATMVLKAEEEGLLSVDEDIRTFWPSFNPPTTLSASRTLSLRDAMSHRSGMPRHDAIWRSEEITNVDSSEDCLRVLQFLDPDKDIRYKAEYTNNMFLVAGEAVAHVRNTTWENLLQKEILGPLGMEDTYPTLGSVPKDARSRLSRPYFNKHAFDQYLSLDTVAPAGSMVSTAGDLAKWLATIVQVCDSGSADAPTVLGCKQFKKMITGNIPFGNYNPTYGMYAMGFWNEPYTAKNAPSGMAELVHHAGNSAGFTSHIAFLPNLKYGIAVLTNEQATSAADALVLKIVDMILKQSLADWDDVFGKVQAAQRNGLVQNAINHYKQLLAGSVPPSFPDLKEYEGLYMHPAYGQMTFSVSAGANGPTMKATFKGGETVTVHHTSGDNFLIGDIPDLAKDPTILFLNTPELVTFESRYFGTAMKVYGLQSSFDTNVAPIFFSKVLSSMHGGGRNAQKPLFYVNQILSEYPIGY